MSVEITATQQNVFPPRVQLAVTGLTLGDAIELYRLVGSQRTLVRAGSADAVTDTSFVRVDAELPFGVSVGYVAVVNGDDGPTVDATTYTLTGEKAILSDAITGLSAQVRITDWSDRQRQVQASVFNAGGRSVAVVGTPAGYSSQLVLYTETSDTYDDMLSLLKDATSGIVQLRNDGTLEGVSAYLAVLDWTESRLFAYDATPRRRWTLSVLETDSWAPELAARDFSYSDVEAAYGGLDYSDAEGDFATYLDAMLADWSQS